MNTLIERKDLKLSDETYKLIESIADLAAKMKLADPDITNFLVAICEMQDNEQKCQIQKLIDFHTMSVLSKKIAKMEKENSILNRDLEGLEQTVDIQECNKVKLKDTLKFMKRKSSDYTSKIKECKAYSKMTGFNEDLRHTKLVEKSKSIQILEEQYQTAVKMYESYRSLPPNESLAKLEVQKKKEELEKLEKQFAQLLEVYEKKRKC